MKLYPMSLLPEDQPQIRVSERPGEYVTQRALFFTREASPRHLDAPSIQLTAFQMLFLGNIFNLSPHAHAGVTHHA